jgi:hypothetical protein
MVIKYLKRYTICITEGIKQMVIKYLKRYTICITEGIKQMNSCAAPLSVYTYLP